MNKLVRDIDEHEANPHILWSYIHKLESKIKEPNWKIIDEDAPANRLTEFKTKTLVENNDYRVAGYILLKDKKICLSYGAAIRWINYDELFNIMHPDSGLKKDIVEKGCSHNYVRDDEAINYHCCQLCGDIIHAR